MLNCGPETSVTDWVIDCPAAVTVFQQLRIDYSCGGISLEYACHQKGLHVVSVMDQIQKAEHEQRMQRDFGSGPNPLEKRDAN